MNLNKSLHISPTLFWSGLVLIIVTGLIHLIEAPENYADAAYKGILFGVNTVMAGVAAYGIWHQRIWGWGLGVLVTGGAFVMYIVSRTVGLPGLGVDPNWLEPIGVLSLLVEGSFLIVAGVVLRQPTLPRNTHPAH